MSTNKEISALVNLEYAVASVFNELNIDETHYERHLQFAIDCFIELGLFHLKTFKIEFLDVSDAGVVLMPDDYIDYISIGVNKNGRFYSLTKDDLMIPPTTLDCGLDSSTDRNRYKQYGSSIDYYSNNTMYTYGGGYNEAYYTVDDKNRRIIVAGSLVPSQIVLYYVSTGISADGKTLVPRKAIPSIKAYIHWKRIEYMPNIPMQEKMRKEILYNQELKKLRQLEFPFNYDEYVDSKNENTYQGVKR